MMKEESLRSSTATPSGECLTAHHYFIAETFAVEGEGTIGAVIVCTSCGDSRLVSYKVANPGSSVLLKEKGERK